MARKHPEDWQRARFERVREALAQQSASTPRADQTNLVEGAVRDPGQADGKRVRVTINADILDRLFKARRIGQAEYSAGRTYQRLLEMKAGAPALDGGGVKIAQGDDLLARIMERATLVQRELERIQNLIGARSERLLRQALVELNPNSGAPWTLDELAGPRDNQRAHAFAIGQRIVECLEDLAAHWRAVRLD
jgi:hypothetical protein